jgi:hypothetical protein
MRNRIGTATAVGLLLLGIGGSASAEDKLIGSLTAVDVAAKTLSVTETGTSDPITFSVGDKTLIREGNKEVALGALEPGRSVKISYEKGEGVAVARRIDVSLPLGEDRSKPMPKRVDGAR